eukprot:UN06587
MKRVCRQMQRRAFSTNPKTGILLMNMGGPADPKDTKPFLYNLFNDNDIIALGGGSFQQRFASIISNRRSPSVEKKYEEIGGSPITKWHDYQGNELQKRLNEKETDEPYKVYTVFRYTQPFTKDVLTQMKSDGIERAIAFPTYPQWSCTTSGSNMNELWRQLTELKLENEFKWSVIDRWYQNPLYHDTLLEQILKSMKTQFDDKERNEVVILFSAHSVPMKVVEKGDTYVGEIYSTCKTIMNRLPEYAKAHGHDINWNGNNEHFVAWQSKVGFLPWMVPKTEATIKELGKRGVPNILTVPIAFVCDHIETLHEIGIEYKEEADKVGIKN